MKTMLAGLLIGVIAAWAAPAFAGGDIHFVKGTLKCGDDYVQGDVVNGSARVIDYVEVRVVLTDSSGTRVGDTFTNTLNLKPGEKWHYKAPVFDEDYAHCDVTLATH
jgi:hypothetical protein